MAGPQYATAQVLQVGPSNAFYVAGILDANGNLAAATTNFKQRPSGLLIPELVDANGIPLTTSRITTQITDVPLAASATYTQAPWIDAQALAVTFVSGSVYADRPGTLYVDFSDDGTNVYGTSATTLAFSPATAGTPNGQTLPYPVELPTRYFRFRYVNGATAQGTFQVYQTPMSDWSPRDVGLTGSLAPLSALAKTTVSTLSYSDFAANATYYGFLNGVLTPNARKRLVAMAVTTTFNEAVTWAKVGVYDSTMLPSPSDNVLIGINEASVNLTINLGSFDTEYAGSETYPALIEIADSLFFTITVGATAPTAGELAIYKREVF